jgi:NAD(P)-dependent dehydrogenase (short-subunit alcohol dehydrogenase family)
MNILITGTSSGIGYGLAKEYLNRGANLWGISRRDQNEFDSKNYSHINLDLTDHKITRKEIPEFVKGVKEFDLVVLNAGILGDIKLMHEIDIDSMKEVVEINVWSNKLLLDILLFDLKITIKQVTGMSSKESIRSTPGWGPYSMSKAGLNMLMNIYAKEYPETHFSSFAPGLVDTEIQESIYQMKDTEKYPTLEKMHKARHTDLMPDAVNVAPKLIAGIKRALEHENGSFVDVRDMEGLEY